MKKVLSILLLFTVLCAAISCKDEKKGPKPIDPEKEKYLKKEKKPLTEEEKAIVGSVMSKIMATEELKTMSSYLVSAKLTDTLFKKKGPFTVFAPSSDAFNALAEDTKKMLLNPSNKDSLATLLYHHIVNDNIDSSVLVQKIKDNGGSYKMTTLSGETLTAYRNGDAILVKDASGTKATIGKSDILGGNGVVHIIDKTLGTSN